jgi:K+/H+ antiporter YhaU regulatory subunit KhtT
MTRRASSALWIGGAYERPQIVEDLEMALGELQIEADPGSRRQPLIGKTLAEAAFRAKAGITVIAILRQPSRSAALSRRTASSAATRS